MRVKIFISAQPDEQVYHKFTMSWMLKNIRHTFQCCFLRTLIPPWHYASFCATIFGSYSMLHLYLYFM